MDSLDVIWYPFRKEYRALLKLDWGRSFFFFDDTIIGILGQAAAVQYNYNEGGVLRTGADGGRHDRNQCLACNVRMHSSKKAWKAILDCHIDC